MLATLASSNAANYIVSNVVTGSGSGDVLFENGSSSNLLSGGIVAMGYFPADYVISSDLGDIGLTISNFTSVASALAGSPSASLEGSFAGYVEGPTVDGAALTGANALIGRALYVFVGNGPTLETSTEFALKQIAVLAADEPLENDYLANPIGGATPIIGSFDTFTGDVLSNGGTVTYTTLKLEAIPEPSTVLLGAIGALGLLRRRR